MKIEKVKKLLANLRNKTEYVIQIRNLKQALNHGLIFKKFHRIIRFKQKAWLKSYIYINTDLRKNSKNDFEKDFFNLMNNAVFEKTLKNVRKFGDIKVVTTKRRRNYLVSESNYHTTNFFTQILLGIEMKKLKYTWINLCI